MDGTQKPRQDNGSGPDSGLTLNQRQELARTYQRQALARRESLAVNLSVFVGYSMSIAHAIADQMQRQLTQGAFTEETRPQFQQNLDAYDKLVRTSERLARLERQVTTAFLASPYPT